MFVLVRGLALVLALVFGSLFFVVSLLVFKYGVLSRLRPLQFAFFFILDTFLWISLFSLVLVVISDRSSAVTKILAKEFSG